MIVELKPINDRFKVAGFGEIMKIGSLLECHLFIEKNKLEIGKDVIIAEYPINIL